MTRTRTSTRVATGLRGGGGGSPLDSIKEKLSALTLQQKLLIGLAIIALLIFVFALININRANQYVPLFNGRLSIEDIRDIRVWLDSHGITEYSVDEALGVIYIHPKYHSQVYVALRKEGYPHQPVKTLDVNPNSLHITSEQWEAYLKSLNESTLVEILRNMDKIADARVQLAIPKRELFSTTKPKAKASVFLILKPGEKLTSSEVNSIRHIVANAIPELSPENVTVVDQYGRLYKSLSDQDELASSSNYLQIQKRVEEYYKNKITEMLVPVVGAGKFVVAVNVELDWDQVVKTIKTYGGPGDIDKIISEKIKKYTQEYSGKGNNDNESASKIREEKIINRVFDEINQQIVKARGTIKRLTVSVLLDNQSPAVVKTVQAAVKNAVGFDEPRGDKIVVGSLPFASQTNPFMEPAPAVPATAPATTVPKPPVASAHLYIALAAVGLIGLGLAVVFFFKQQGVIKEKAGIVLQAASPSPESVASTKISDLTTDKLGNVTVPDTSNSEQALRTTVDELKRVAKENPTEIAELLKSTWLSEK